VFFEQTKDCVFNECLELVRHAPPDRRFPLPCARTAMISILIAEALSARTIDKLNEIPEFEISETTNLSQENFKRELQNVDALVVSATSPLPAAALKNAANLKLVIVSGGKSDSLATVLAGRKGTIEVRVTPPATAGSDQEGLDVIAILKDFFNV
jgi:phosphoglycerate dehydrogenase-like enzyme